MVDRTRLTDEQIQSKLSSLPGWSVSDNRLRKSFVFADFVEAFGWMTRVALVAEKLDHHPDWKNVYKTVDVELWTHDAGGLTELDFELAQAMNRFGP